MYLKIFNYIISFSVLSLLLSCGGSDNKVTPNPEPPVVEEVIVTGAKLETNTSGEVNLQFANNSTASTASVSSIPTIIKLKELTLSNNTKVAKDEPLQLNTDQVSFKYSNKTYTVKFTTNIQVGQGSETKVIDLTMRWINESGKRLVFDANKKAIVTISDTATLPLTVFVRSIELSTNATSEYVAEHEISVTSSQKTFTFNVVSGDRQSTAAYTIEFQQNTADTNSIITFAFLPNVRDNAGNSGNKKGISRTYYGVITGTTIDIHIPTQTKERLTPTIIHSGKSVNPANEAEQLFTAGVFFEVTSSNGIAKTYSLNTFRDLPDEFLDINKATFGPNTVNVGGLTTTTVTDVPIDAAFIFGFTHDITPGSATTPGSPIRLIKLLQGTTEVPITIAQGTTASTIVITPNANLLPSTTYTIVFGTGLKTTVSGTTYFILEEKRSTFTTQ